FGAGGSLQFRLRPHPLDAAVGDDDGGVRHRGTPGSIDQRKTVKNRSFGLRGASEERQTGDRDKSFQVHLMGDCSTAPERWFDRVNAGFLYWNFIMLILLTIIHVLVC